MTALKNSVSVSFYPDLFVFVFPFRNWCIVDLLKLFLNLFISIHVLRYPVSPHRAIGKVYLLNSRDSLRWYFSLYFKITISIFQIWPTKKKNHFTSFHVIFFYPFRGSTGAIIYENGCCTKLLVSGHTFFFIPWLTNDRESL